MALSQYMAGVPNVVAPTTPAPFAGRDYNEMVGKSLESFLNPNSSYIQNARQRGAEYAQQRGGINSSIAAGAAERAATDAAAPLAQAAVNAQLQQENIIQEDWLAKQNFSRELASLPLTSSINMLNQVQQYSLQDPALYTPEVVSGYSNFFQSNFNDVIGRFFGGAK